MKYGIRIELKSDFKVIKETLERIGICNREKKVITPSCYILHSKGEYYIIHFKFLLALDGFKKDIEERDVIRQNSIATLLHNWGMVEILDEGIYQEELREKIFVLSHSEKREGYTVNHKYQFKNRKTND